MPWGSCRRYWPCTWPAAVGKVRLRALPPSWQERLAQPNARHVYSDVRPVVLLRYDVPDLVRALGSRLIIN
jgi:hypothetical protein